MSEKGKLLSDHTGSLSQEHKTEENSGKQAGEKTDYPPAAEAAEDTNEYTLGPADAYAIEWKDKVLEKPSAILPELKAEL